MKQILFTLAAFAAASAAVAETTWTELDEVTLSYADEGWAGSTYILNALSFDFCITSDSLTEGKAILAYVASGYVADDNTDQVTFTLEKVEDSYTLRTAASNYTTEVSELVNSASISITGLQENVVYTLSTTPTEANPKRSNVTLTGNDGSLFSASYPVSTYLFKPEDVTDAVISADVAMMNAAFAVSVDAPTASIPEPTTTTLSLLTLAGLAARRRRK